jgi:hypothetical protein
MRTPVFVFVVDSLRATLTDFQKERAVWVDKRILVQGRRCTFQQALPKLPLQPLLCDNIVPLTDKVLTAIYQSPHCSNRSPATCCKDCMVDVQVRWISRPVCQEQLHFALCLMLSQLCGRPTRPRTARLSAHTISGVLAMGKIKQCFVTNRPTYRQVPLGASCVSVADYVSIFLELIHGGDVQVAWIRPLGHHTETP